MTTSALGRPPYGAIAKFRGLAANYQLAEVLGDRKLARCWKKDDARRVCRRPGGSGSAIVSRPLLRHSREDNGEAEDEPGQRDEFGNVVTIRPHVLPSQASQADADAQFARSAWRKRVGISAQITLDGRQMKTWPASVSGRG